MPVRASCPRCQALFDIPETALGKHLRCQRCQQVFAVRLPLKEDPPKSDSAPRHQQDKPVTPLARKDPLTKNLPKRAPTSQHDPAPPRERRTPSSSARKSRSLLWLAVAGGLTTVVLCLGCGITGLWWLLPATPDPEPLVQFDGQAPGNPPQAVAEANNQAPVPPTQPALPQNPPATPSIAAPQAPVPSNPPPARPPTQPTNPPGIPTEVLVKKLPGSVSAAALGGGGRFLALTLPSQRNVAVFDLIKGEVVKYLPTGEDDVLVAAGLEKLIVVLPQANLIQRYNLLTLEREATVPVPVNMPIQQAVMGSASRGPLLLVINERRSDRKGNALLDPYTFKPWPVEAPPPPYGSSDWRISGDGRVLTSRRPADYPQEHTIYALEERSFKTYRFDSHDAAGLMSPGAEGRYVYTARGLFNAEGKPIGKQGSYSDGSRYCLPAAEGEAFYLTLKIPGFPHGQKETTGKVSLHLARDDRPLAELTGVATPPGLNTWGKERFGTDQRYYLIPSANRLVYLPPTMDQLVIHPVDIHALLASCPHDYLVIVTSPPREAVRGTLLEYVPQVKSKRGGIKISLDAGPTGMRLDPNGKLTWKVPVDHAENTESVILSIRDASEQEQFQTFKLAIRNAGKD